MPELLLELLSEEIPARMQAAAAEQLKRLVTKELDAAGLSYTDARAYVTPRRLTLVVEGLPERQPDRRIERKGPRLGSAEKAIDGFGKSVGLPQHEIEYIIGLEVGGPSHTAELPALTVEVSAQSLGKGDFYVAQIMEMGKATADVLPFLIYKAIKFMDWSKSMEYERLAVYPLPPPVTGHDSAALFTELALDMERAQTKHEVLIVDALGVYRG